ncbi:hypothetical protein ACFQ3S_18790 [Mucilaginibacter terrae]|uniref:hypothetical protein n=1 Tax=Mucilaginibacter terrae TaxID=1955052 RepID=UPI00362EF3E3
MKLQKIILIGLLTLLLLISTVIGHFLPPTGILTSPIVISIIAGLIMFSDNSFNVIVKSILTYLFIGLNDIGIKLFSGGIHDTEGMGWIHMLLFIGLVPSFIMLLVSVVRDKNSTNWIKAFSILLFILLINIHLQLFDTLGVQEN